ncbi:MAG: chemotaxis protein CheB [Mariprofundus sp.]|nr:chemotaxis protein CheB [Mariprofundus sp.]
MSSIKLLVIEPDARARLAMVSMLKKSSEISVVGIASDAMQARMQVKIRQPDVLLIATDQHSERVDEFLAELMQATPLPVLMLSDKVLPGSDGERLVMRAGGAIMKKPADGISAQDQEFYHKLAQQLQRITLNFKPAKKAAITATVKAVVKTASSRSVQNKNRRHNPLLNTLVAIGASTGGTNALRSVVAEFPADFSAVVIVQHIPKAFADSFIDKLNKASPMHVVSASDGAAIHHGYIYVGAGDEHFRIEKQGSGLVCRVGGQEKVSGHCPSVNALFDSVALHVGSKAVGALMTGMGDDGATGLKKMRDKRARTLAQDKESSVVWGMPGVAVKLGAAEEQVSLKELGKKLVQLVK